MMRRKLCFLLVVLVLIGYSFLLAGCPDPEPEISVFFDETGETQVMPIEDYIMGVVAGEMKEDWPLEAYAAQAIIARTFTMHFIEDKGGSMYGTDISTDHEEAQAFDREGVTQVIRRAVEDTRGQVIKHDDRYIRAWFHAAAGGRTATAEEGLNYEEGNPPYIGVIDSPDMGEEVPEDVRKWTARFPSEEILAALGEMDLEGEVELQGIESIRGREKGPSGRFTVLEITDGEETVEVSFPDFRVALEAMELRSTFLTEPVTVEDGVVEFTGKGFGHGVGMSQWGAYVMAGEGRSPQDIINHYYKGVEIVEDWE